MKFIGVNVSTRLTIIVPPVRQLCYDFFLSIMWPYDQDVRSFDLKTGPLVASQDMGNLVNFSFYSFLWTPAQRKRATMLYFANVFYLFIYFLWPPYSPALVNGGSRKFYTWWTLSVIREVTTWIFSLSSLNYRVGQKVTKFGIFSDPARKLSALTPERGRIL